MDVKKALQAFNSQRHNAKRRGIEWEMTFKEWCDFWADDIDRRGPRRDQLGMHRIMDSGPYKIGNVRKGHPRENVKTRECAQWDRGRRVRPFAVFEREPDEGLPYQGYASVWDRLIA